jgi:hypothetical protein
VPASAFSATGSDASAFARDEFVSIGAVASSPSAALRASAALRNALTDVQVESEARASLERHYLGGHDILFPDAAAEWASHVEIVARLARLAEITSVVEPTKPSRRRSSVEGRRAEALASRLTDDARVKAYEILGERERAVSIMERRLRA